MPKDYYVGDKALYVKGLADGKAMFTADGKMPADGPETVLKVLHAPSAEPEGQDRRPVQDLHDELRRRAQTAAK